MRHMRQRNEFLSQYAVAVLAALDVRFNAETEYSNIQFKQIVVCRKLCPHLFSINSHFKITWLPVTGARANAKGPAAPFAPVDEKSGCVNSTCLPGTRIVTLSYAVPGRCEYVFPTNIVPIINMKSNRDEFTP